MAGRIHRPGTGPPESLELLAHHLASFSRHVPLLPEVGPGCVAGFEPSKSWSRRSPLWLWWRAASAWGPDPLDERTVKASAGRVWTRGSRRGWRVHARGAGDRVYCSPTVSPTHPPTPPRPGSASPLQSGGSGHGAVPWGGAKLLTPGPLRDRERHSGASAGVQGQIAGVGAWL